MPKDLIIENIANIKAVTKGNFSENSRFLEKPVICGKDITNPKFLPIHHLLFFNC